MTTTGGKFLSLLVLLHALLCLSTGASLMETGPKTHGTEGCGKDKPATEPESYGTECYGLNCTCADGVVDCQSLGFTFIPEVPPNTTHLIMRSNDITHVSVLPYPNLKVLDLSSNEITFVEEDAFVNLANLEELHIHSNRLNFSTIGDAVFDPLINLKVLNMGNNFMWKTTNTYPDRWMRNLKYLEELTMDGLRIPIPLGRGYSNLTSLNSLTFLSKMKSLDNDTFSNLADLPITSLRLWSGWLEKLASHTFAHFSKLELLDLSFNPRLGFNAAAEAWPGLEFTKIETLIFNHSTAYGSDIITMDEQFLIGLNKTNITTFCIDANTIVTMEGVFSYHLPYLQNFAFAYNRLTQVTPIVLDIARMKNLVHLDASQQSIRHNRTQTEILAGIGITSTYVETLSSTTGIDFDLAWQEITEEDPRVNSLIDEFDGLFLPLVVPSTTETVNLSASLSVSITVLPRIVIFNTLNFQYLDYSYNGLEELRNEIFLTNRSIHNITWNVRGNKLWHFGEYFSRNGTLFGELTEGFLAGSNNLGDLLMRNGTKPFAGMQYLKKVDFSDNFIERLEPDAFEPLPMLEELDLSQNSLRQIRFSLTNISNLQILDLTSNLLSHIGKESRHQIEDIARARHSENKSLELRLLENPFVCSCETLDFLKWVNQQHDGLCIPDFELFKCEYGGDIVVFGELDSIISELRRKCNITNILLITIIPTAFIALVVALSIFAWRHKFDIQFWFLNLTIKRKLAQAQEDERKQRYTYDAFVAYCGPDGTLKWVKDCLIPNLENGEENTKRLLVHDRDFHLGTPVTENIIHGMQQSRKIMLIIDQAFLQSEWCKYETHAAHHESISRGRDVIIAVLLTPASALLTDSYMYHTLKSLLKKRTYIEWPRNKLHQDEFWQRLHKAVEDPIMRPLQCVCGRALDRTFSHQEEDDNDAVANERNWVNL